MMRKWGRSITAAGVLVAALVLAGCASGGDTSGGGNGGGATQTVAPGDLPTGVEGAAHFDDFALVVGDGDIDVRLWFDPRCPVCGHFEEAAGERIAALVDDGTITYSLHPMNFLDRASQGTRYSSRAGSALTCVAVEQPELVLDSLKAIYDAIPPEGTAGLENAEITSVLVDGGVDAGIGDCVDAETYTAWVQASNDAALAGIEGADISAIQGTPTLIVNGTAYRGDVIDTEAIVAFITSGGQS
ncbi:hypothetical protein ET445_11765 [Agromyces protaetiae]|uniref:Thioredoxin-like fold domain-containing protein n=1 Tax=Agromyces protaetiae TaxID=2509455 RepID=A0A4P6FIW2_9MICO|nr:thioredoxin domain-containing protein [Agromyces protaetiae]QAY73917.1 hypothetical protein ET445_11765 [Agromyces protaetiae]